MITAVIPVSPIPSHPDTAILDETIQSIRHFLPDIEILLTFDGVRSELEDRRADYEEHIRRVVWKAAHEWGNTVPFVYDWHKHQIGMMRAMIGEIRTPLLMYVEHDTPLLVDREIDFPMITEFLVSDRSHLVRLYHEEVIPYEHLHLYHEADGLNFIRTSQWSQRPHVARVDYYKRIILGEECFRPDANSFIEDKMHTWAEQAWRCRGFQGWFNEHRLHVYDPHGDGQAMRRSGHTDGRKDAPKFEDSQIL